MRHGRPFIGWVLAVGAVLQAACVYPIMTDEVAVAASATALTPAERSIMYLGGTRARYRLIEPEIPDLDWSTWRANYSPPGAVAVAARELVISRRTILRIL